MFLLSFFFETDYPPEAPKDPNSRSIYYECLRPELVLKNKVPLCSDAFSSWQEDDPHHREYNEEVKRATDRLFNEIIPTFSRKLNERFFLNQKKQTFKKLNHINL